MKTPQAALSAPLQLRYKYFFFQSIAKNICFLASLNRSWQMSKHPLYAPISMAHILSADLYNPRYTYSDIVICGSLHIQYLTSIFSLKIMTLKSKVQILFIIFKISASRLKISWNGWIGRSIINGPSSICVVIPVGRKHHYQEDSLLKLAVGGSYL